MTLEKAQSPGRGHRRKRLAAWAWSAPGSKVLAAATEAEAAELGARHGGRSSVEYGTLEYGTLAWRHALYYKVLMNLPKRTIAATELLLIFPAALFITALFVRNLQPLQYEPARTAERIVTWYAARPRIGLWGLLIALPLAVLFTGCGILLRSWSVDVELWRAMRQTLTAIRAHLTMLLVAGATLIAGAVIAIVALHILTD